LKKSSGESIRGELSRSKVFLLRGVTVEMVKALLGEWIQ